MRNIHLHIIGSDSLSKLFKELDLNYIVSSNVISEYNIKDSFIRIIFAENLQLDKLKKLLLDNVPTVFLLNNRNFLLKINYVY